MLGRELIEAIENDNLLDEKIVVLPYESTETAPVVSVAIEEDENGDRQVMLIVGE